ncbi:hypothetical protein EVJ58_g3227 [Rhodofomes roseus]|uniref:Uncharacterized protein n=1 Tax=Rhodofomes roseus TaxID=34475 RepID=A0A4Y9YLV5_9APHY|nr:hypothetical protein EVJ58_g3227 [Rhodofomes roseus]
MGPPTLWDKVKPYVDTLMHTPAFDLFTPLEVNPWQYMATFATLYMAAFLASDDTERHLLEQELYTHLDHYFAAVARRIYERAPTAPEKLIVHLVLSFARFTNRVKLIAPLFSVVDKGFVQREAAAGRGWWDEDPVGEAPYWRAWRATAFGRTRARLMMWGYEDGCEVERYADVMASAAAATSPSRVVPVSALAYRRFRMEVVEPLSAVPPASPDLTLFYDRHATRRPRPPSRLDEAMSHELRTVDTYRAQNNVNRRREIEVMMGDFVVMLRKCVDEIGMVYQFPLTPSIRMVGSSLR